MRRGFLAAAETTFCVLALCFVLGAFINIPLRLQGIELRGGETNPYNTVANAVLLAGTVLLVALRWREFVFVARHGGAVNLFLLLALASVFWSQAPVISARRWTSLLLAVTFAYYLVACYPIERVIRLFAAALGTVMVASTVVSLAFPAIGVMSEPSLAGAWCGVFVHKSSLGTATVISVLCFGWLWRHEPQRRLLHTLALVLTLFLAVMARSKTAQMTILLIVSFSVFLPLLRLPGLVRIWAVYGMFVAAAVFGTILLLFFGDIMEMLGKDASLTGRVPTWMGLLKMTTERPLGGHGYSAFFIDSNPAVEDIWRRAGWTMWTAHSSFIEVVLDLGIPGLVLAVWLRGEMIWRSLHAWIAGTLPWASFAAVYGITDTVTAIVESGLFRTGDMPSVLFALLYVALRVHGAARAAAIQASSLRPGRQLHPLYGLYR